MSSPRYLAAHMLLPRFVQEQGSSAVLDAFERNDADFFIPVWMEAGFRFTSRLLYTTQRGLRLGIMTLPMPREWTEAYFCALVAKPADPNGFRYFLCEKGEDTGTVIGEWAGSAHRNHGAGPAFTGDLAGDRGKFVDRVIEICAA